MLSEEEKKAIERMYDFIHTCEVGIEKHGQYYDLFEKDKQAIETVLNLITRLQKENEEKDIKLKELQHRKDNQEKRFKQYKEDIEKQHEEIYEDLVSKQEEKDKQIDLMALAILNYDDQLIINRYKNIDEVKKTFIELSKAKGE